MRNKLISSLAGAVFSFAASGLAVAADMAVKMPVKAPPPPPPVQDWSGIYVGLEGGYGWGHQHGGLTVPFTLNGSEEEFAAQNPVVPPGSVPFEFAEFQTLLNQTRRFASVPLGAVNQNGGLFGGFIGGQKQWDKWVFGLEADIDAANMKGSATGSSQFFASATDADSGGLHSITLNNSASLESTIDALATVRGKAGFAPAPNWLIYGTGGLAFAHLKNSLTSSQSLAYSDPDDGCCAFNLADTFIASANRTMFGWTIGAGIDWKYQVDPGSAWVFGVEYLYYQFPARTFTFNDPSGGSFSFDSKESVNAIKGRISYLFSFH